MALPTNWVVVVNKTNIAIQMANQMSDNKYVAKVQCNKINENDYRIEVYTEEIKSETTVDTSSRRVLPDISLNDVSRGKHKIFFSSKLMAEFDSSIENTQYLFSHYPYSRTLARFHSVGIELTDVYFYQRFWIEKSEPFPGELIGKE